MTIAHSTHFCRHEVLERLVNDHITSTLPVTLDPLQCAYVTDVYRTLLALFSPNKSHQPVVPVEHHLFLLLLLNRKQNVIVQGLTILMAVDG